MLTKNIVDVFLAILLCEEEQRGTHTTEARGTTLLVYTLTILPYVPLGVQTLVDCEAETESSLGRLARLASGTIVVLRRYADMPRCCSSVK